MSIYSSIWSENFQKPLAPSMVKISKKQDRTYITELPSLFVKHIFYFRFRYFQLPVSEKRPTSGFEVVTGGGKIPHAIALVELYIPPKFYANRSTRLGGDSFAHIKCNASQVLATLGTVFRVQSGFKARSGPVRVRFGSFLDSPVPQNIQINSPFSNSHSFGSNGEKSHFFLSIFLIFGMSFETSVFDFCLTGVPVSTLFFLTFCFTEDDFSSSLGGALFLDGVLSIFDATFTVEFSDPVISLNFEAILSTRLQGINKGSYYSSKLVPSRSEFCEKIKSYASQKDTKFRVKHIGAIGNFIYI